MWCLSFGPAIGHEGDVGLSESPPVERVSMTSSRRDTAIVAVSCRLRSRGFYAIGFEGCAGNTLHFAFRNLRSIVVKQLEAGPDR